MIKMDKKIILKGGKCLSKKFISVITQKEANIQIKILEIINQFTNDINPPSIEELLVELNQSNISQSKIILESLNDLLKDNYIEISIKLILIKKEEHKEIVFILTEKGVRYLEFQLHQK
jgi:hypothetical protein